MIKRSQRILRIPPFGAFLFALLLLNPGVCAGDRSVTLSWESGDDPTAIGTYVYWGVVTNGTAQHVAKVDAGAAMTNRITGLAEGQTYYFYVTAYNTSRIESEPSNRVEFRPLVTSEQIPVSIDLRQLTTVPSVTEFSLVDQEPNVAGYLDGGRPVETYSPPQGFTGKVSLTYQFNEGLPDDTLALVSIIVATNDPPSAQSAHYDVVAGTTVRLPLTASDPEGQALNYFLLDPQIGSFVAYPMGAVDYLAPAGFTGEDQFTFTVSDGIYESAPATVTISVSAPVVSTNNPPTLNLTANAYHLTLPARAVLSSTVSDADGPSSVVSQWSVAAGPTGATFTAPTSTNTHAEFPVAGSYLLQLVASDGGQTTTGLVTVAVSELAAPSPASIFVEAEDASPDQLSGGMTLQTETTPAGEVVRYAATTTSNGGWLTNTFEIPTAGEYVVWCRVKSRSGGSDSFFVTVDDGPEDVYDTGEGIFSNEYRWSPLCGRGGSDAPVAQAYTVNARVFSLTQGTHRLIFRGRERDTRLDCFMLVNQSAVDARQSAESYRPTVSMDIGFDGVTLRWNAIQGLRYQVLRRTGLGSPWQDLGSVSIPATTASHEYTHKVAGPQPFYGIRLLE